MINRREFMKKVSVVIGAAFVPGMLLKKNKIICRRDEVDRKGWKVSEGYSFLNESIEVTAKFSVGDHVYGVVESVGIPEEGGIVRSIFKLKECQTKDSYMYYLACGKRVIGYRFESELTLHSPTEVAEIKGVTKDLKHFYGIDCESEVKQMI